MKDIKNKKVIIGFAIMLAIIFVFSMIFLTIIGNNEEKVNPFDYVDIKFTGLSGVGNANVEIILNDKGIDDHNLFLHLSKETGLKEGEEITLTATSYSFDLLETSKTYIVNGLDFYLNNLNAITSAGLKSIHDQTKSMNDNNIRAFKLTDNVLYRENVKMYLLLDEDGNNEVYDIEKVTFTLKEKMYPYYLVSYYKNLVIRNDEDSSISFEGAKYTGESISIPGGAIIGFESINDVKKYILKNGGKEKELLEK